MTNKICNKCEQNKNIRDFCISNGKYSNKCKNCQREYQKEWREKQKTKVVILNIKEKVCRICNTVKHIENFPKRFDCSNGYRNECISCRSKDVKQYFSNYYQKKKETTKEKQFSKQKDREEEIKKLEESGSEKKICLNCNLNKVVSDFGMKNGKTRPNCKECHNSKDRKYYQEVYKQKVKTRRETEIEFKLKTNHRTVLHRCLFQKNKQSIEYLNCDVSQLKLWLEFQFDSDMNWDNYGKVWTIDHILPLSRFNLIDEKEQMLAFSWTNLQPSKNNFSKNNKILLYEYFNSIISVHRFIQKYKLNLSGYQTVKETLQWLREYLRYGKKSTDEIGEISKYFDNLSI